MALVLGGLTLLIVLGCLQTAKAECPSGSDIVQQAQECFTKNGLEMPMLTATSMAEKEKNPLNAALNQDSNQFCSKRESYKKALECGFNNAVCIMPDPYKGYVTNPANAGKIVDESCKGIGNLDLDCFKNKTQEMIDCATGKVGPQTSQNTDTESVMKSLCKAYQWASECILTVYKSCGCSSVKTQQTIAIDLLYPPACPAFQTTRVQCDAANPQRYADNKGQRSTGWTTPLLVSFSFVLFKFLTM